MAFNYISPSGIRLTASELLESIDKFPYPLNGYTCLGDLHHQLKGGVELSDQKKTRSHCYTITVEERNAIIAELDDKISEIDNILQKLHKQYVDARKNKNDAKARQIEEEMGLYGEKRIKLEKTRDVYQNAPSCNGGFKIQINIDLLGEYDPSLKKVILYYKSISSEDLLSVVYVHEMMHAYLDVSGGNCIDEIEEPIVEYAMLKFFMVYDMQICQKAELHVKNKQQSLGVGHYGFGYCIFKNPNGVDWLEDYLKVKRTLFRTNLDVILYLDYWKTGIYPNKKEERVLEALYKALHQGVSKKLKVFTKMDSKVFLEELKKKQSTGMLAKAVVFTQRNAFDNYLGQCDTINGGHNDYLTSLESDDFNNLLDHFGLPRNIYHCKADDLVQVLDLLVNNAKNQYALAALKHHHSACRPALCYFLWHLLNINSIVI